uniref:Ig-like domain-containing protein n=1 Tax=Trichobilharzia regenti TaxID=157069 RepID=A0AA85JS28_TRIRE|nr:unnamed protein product [Trichobilharzia regenti]
MSYGCYLISWILLIFVLIFHKLLCEQTTCLPTSGSSAELLLGSSDLLLNEDLLKLCPENTSNLYVSSRDLTYLRVLSYGFYKSSVLPNLQQLRIDVGRLEISRKNFRNDISSSLVSLTISNCNLESLPPLGMLHGLDKLRTVDLSHNKLRVLPIDLLQYSRNIISVNLSHNLVSTLPSVPYSLTVYVDNNRITCSCVNAKLLLKGNFEGLPVCHPWPSPCTPTLETDFYANSSGSDMISSSVNSSVLVLTGQHISFVCEVKSDLPYILFWVSPVGIIPPSNTDWEADAFSLSYVVQPILAATVFHVVHVNEMISTLTIENTRGHLTGKWSCVAYSSEATSHSPSIELQVISSLYHAQIYYISLCYGYGGMVLLLLVGIIGGTIRYCSETHCLRRPQPSCAFKGKTYVGVIPVPEVDGEENQRKSNDCDKSFDIPLGNSPVFSKYIDYFGPNSRWRCNLCKTVHFVEKIQEIEDSGLLIAAGDVPVGRIAPDGEIMLMDSSDLDMELNTSDRLLEPISEQYKLESHETQQPLMDGSKVNSSRSEATFKHPVAKVFNYEVCVRSGNCVVRVRLDMNDLVSFRCPSSAPYMDNSACVPYLPRPGSADVKLVVSNEKLAQEYREALAGLAQAVENPDPAHFREKLEDFRSRLCHDVGHGVKVLRGEFQGLRAKSAKSVASLRSQSSAAAQRMRAGLSYGMEQMKDGMRSVAELCGASGTIGQTISVVSVYVDEKDQTKKEKHISDFVF